MATTEIHGETSAQTLEAGQRIANASDTLSVAKVYAVATAFHEQVMTYDPTANDGKGRFKGGKVLYQTLCDGAAIDGKVVPQEFEGQISKVARVLVDLGRHLLDLGHAQTRWEGCEMFVSQYGDAVALYNARNAKDPSSASLAQMVANLLAWAGKNDIDGRDVLAELVAQIEA